MRVYPLKLPESTDTAFVSLPFIRDGEIFSPFSCALSLRAAGDQSYDPAGVNSNRDRFFVTLGLDPSRVAARTQTHSRDVIEVDSSCLTSLPPGDGMASADASVHLSITVADCLPIFLVDPGNGAFALVHSGWKGTGILAVAIDLLKDRWRVRPEELLAVFGPCISRCSYQVPVDRANRFDEDFGLEEGQQGPLGSPVHRDAGGSYIDLQAANALILEKYGVRDLAVCPACTYTDERLGSFRREGPEHFTRMAAIVGPANREINA
jgi:YfiH family protein